MRPAFDELAGPHEAERRTDAAQAAEPDKADELVTGLSKWR
jgi:hypothetical protein